MHHHHTSLHPNTPLFENTALPQATHIQQQQSPTTHYYLSDTRRSRPTHTHRTRPAPAGHD
jgi:hypothetical protein